VSGSGQVPLTEEELADLYKKGVDKDLSTLGALLSDLKACTDNGAELLEQARAVVHNVKGQGTSFGYPLMTRIGESYYALLKFQASQEELEPVVVKLYEAHLTAMKSIIENQIRGEGPELLHRVATSLKEKVDLVVNR